MSGFSPTPSVFTFLCSTILGLCLTWPSVPHSRCFGSEASASRSLRALFLCRLCEQCVLELCVLCLCVLSRDLHGIAEEAVTQSPNILLVSKHISLCTSSIICFNNLISDYRSFTCTLSKLASSSKVEFKILIIIYNSLPMPYLTCV